MSYAHSDTPADSRSAPSQDLSSLKASIIDKWNDRSATYDDAVGHGLFNSTHRTLWLDALARNTGAREGLHVLDVGCGTGFLSLLLAELGCTVTGIDLATDMMDKARAKAEAANLAIDFRHGDAENPPFEAGTFDLIVCRHVVWTLPDPDAALRNWHRILAPGGRVMPIEGTWKPTTPGEKLKFWFADLLERLFPTPGYNRNWKAEYPGGSGDLPFLGGVPAGTLAAKLEETGFEVLSTDPISEIVAFERSCAPLKRKPLYDKRRRYILVAQRKDAQ